MSGCGQPVTFAIACTWVLVSDDFSVFFWVLSRKCNPWLSHVQKYLDTSPSWTANVQQGARQRWRSVCCRCQQGGSFYSNPKYCWSPAARNLPSIVCACMFSQKKIIQNKKKLLVGSTIRAELYNTIWHGQILHKNAITCCKISKLGRSRDKTNSVLR